MFTLEQFIDYYNKTGRFPGGIYSKGKDQYNQRQLESRYEKYCKKEAKREAKRDEVDEQWIKMREEVYERDSYRCRLWEVLLQSEKEEFIEMIGYQWLKVLNPAHIFKVGSNPSIKYNPDFVVTLNQGSHTRLDAGQSPVNGKQISPEEIENWWIRIVGRTKYERLKNLLKNQ